ncbi:MAG TPA: Crp/Fnr family transcriptional regulator [Bacteroidia bacterium]|nr:Crp/Fnr family transcriptional regulator [Bacteroidia bacterium]
MKICANNKIGSCTDCIKRKMSLLEGLSDEELETLNQNRVVVNFKKGETIYKEYSKPNGLYCLNEGKVKLVKYSDKGNEVIIGLKRPVDFLDVENLLAKQNYNHSAIAFENTSICIIREENFFNVLSKNPIFAMNILKYLSQSILESNEWYLNITQKHISSRIAQTLLKLQDFYGLSSDNFISVALKRSDIAALSCITTANVIRTLRDFEKEKIIFCDKKRIMILNPKKLREIAEL